MILLPSAQCDRCRHFREQRLVERTPLLRVARGFCAAFPDPPGIPMPIWLVEFDHRQPHPGDHGVRFEAKPGERHPIEEEA